MSSFGFQVAKMSRAGVSLSSRMRAVFATTVLLFLGMVAVTLFGSASSTFLSEKVNVHAPRPVVNVLISLVDGDMMYTINGAPAFTFKDDAPFSPPKGSANEYMKAYPIDGATVVRVHAYVYFPLNLTGFQVSNAHINGTFTHLVNGIGLPLYTRLPESDNPAVVFALNDYYDPAFATSAVHDFSSRLPALGSSWIYQPFRNGSRPFDASVNVAVYDVDLRDVTHQQISALKNAGSVVICRLNVGAATEHYPGSALVSVGDVVLPKSVTVGAVPGSKGEHFLNIDLPSVKNAVKSIIQLAASYGCDGTEYMRTQFTAYQSQRKVTEPEELAYHQWLTQLARSLKMFSVLTNDGSLTASYSSSYDALVQQNVCQMFVCRSGIFFLLIFVVFSAFNFLTRCFWSSLTTYRLCSRPETNLFSM